MEFDFNPEKSALLRETRDIGFEEIIEKILMGAWWQIVNHPNAKQYPSQMMIEVAIDGYIYCVPAVIKGKRAFLKTLYPNRKATRRHKEISNG